MTKGDNVAAFAGGMYSRRHKVLLNYFFDHNPTPVVY